MAGFMEKFWDLKPENEGGNLFSFNAAIDGWWSHSCFDVGSCQFYNICFFSALGFLWFHYWSLAIFMRESDSVALLCRLHRRSFRKFMPLWSVKLAIYSELTIMFPFFSACCCFLALWFVNFFPTLNFKASIIYRFFSLLLSPFGLVWTRCLDRKSVV